MKTRIPSTAYEASTSSRRPSRSTSVDAVATASGSSDQVTSASRHSTRNSQVGSPGTTTSSTWADARAVDLGPAADDGLGLAGALAIVVGEEAVHASVPTASGSRAVTSAGRAVADRQTELDRRSARPGRHRRAGPRAALRRWAGSRWLTSTATGPASITIEPSTAGSASTRIGTEVTASRPATERRGPRDVLAPFHAGHGDLCRPFAAERFGGGGVGGHLVVVGLDADQRSGVARCRPIGR